MALSLPSKLTISRELEYMCTFNRYGFRFSYADLGLGMSPAANRPRASEPDHLFLARCRRRTLQGFLRLTYLALIPTPGTINSERKLMKPKNPRYGASQIIEKATEFGACLAGIANVEALKQSPSHFVYGRLNEYKTVGNKEGKLKPGVIVWPENARSAIVIALLHPEEKPELDWWRHGFSGGTAGNRMLISINSKLSTWLEKEKGIKTTQLPYHIEDGGIFLKDAAVMAGLGCIGKNNMVVTAEYGPRVRLRAMFTDELLPETGPADFDPCRDCSMPCRNTCPQNAFRNTFYSRAICNRQMETDGANAAVPNAREKIDKPFSPVKYCRACELSCPVGQ